MGKKKNYIIEQLEITDIANEGNAIGKHEGKVIFVKNVVPGDVVDVNVYRSKNKYAEAETIRFHQYSARRVQPECSHFGECGGCRWQMLNYADQLHYKQKQVEDSFRHLGKFPYPPVKPIIGSDQVYHYRNKLEFTFSPNRWLPKELVASGIKVDDSLAVGFHVPKRFDKILQINRCYLMDELHNEIRNETDQFCRENQLSYFHLIQHEGLVRNMLVRNSTLGEWMVVVLFGQDDAEKIQLVMEFIKGRFPQVNSLQYIINPKHNSSYSDLEVKHYHGKDHIIEKLGSLAFKISAKSFFQTNSRQAEKLYDITKAMAGLEGRELVYDLYTGTGTIACYVADKARKVVGIEYVADAIEDAKINAGLNGIVNTEFFAGDMKDLLNNDFIHTHGKPDVIITDPPRNGMHPDVVKKLNEIAAKRIVYVSCNPVTQVRDIGLLAELYEVKEIQPVDMFPHTYHVENIALLELK